MTKQNKRDCSRFPAPRIPPGPTWKFSSATPPTWMTPTVW